MRWMGESIKVEKTTSEDIGGSEESRLQSLSCAHTFLVGTKLYLC